MNRLWSSGYLALLMKMFAFKFWLSLLYILTPSPNDVVFCFNQFHKWFIVSICIYISSTVIHLVRDPSWKSRRLVLSSKAVLLLPGSEPFYNLWFNFGANKLAPFPGTKLNIIPRKNDKDSRYKGFLWENKDSYMWRRLYHFPWWLH